MALGRHQFFAQDGQGNVVPGAHVEVRSEASGSLASLFSDRAGTVSLGNPFDADSEGFAFFYVAGGAYKVRTYTGTSGAPTTEHFDRYVAVGLLRERDTLLSADLSDFSETVDDRVGDLLVAGSNISLTYDDSPGNALTIAVTGVSGGILTAPQGRITLTSATPVTTADVTGATSVYYAPDQGRYCPVYNGTSSSMRDFTASSTDQVGQTLALDGDSGHTGYHQSGKNFFLFLADVSGTLYWGTGPAWSTDTSVGTGAGTSELEWFEGRWVNKVSMTLRHGSASGNTVTVPARQGTCVGGFRATANGQATDSLAKRLVSNIYNRDCRQLLRNDTTDSWTWSTASYHQVNASAANQVEVFCALSTMAGFLHHKTIPLNSTATMRIVYAGIGINSTTVQSATVAAFSRIGDSTVVTGSPEADYTGFFPLGYTVFQMLEKGAGTDTQTWFGDGGGTDFRSGMAGYGWM